ncbi:oxidoreductase [Modestobacter sp. VKM Ac-2979]|uniref:oxidoreductase n=1 Tax=unclassified Modestobacter TaxID=2643866 RepID=UPI0022AB6CA7|nr:MULTISPECIES: oxidoreductase [unclassified Modestobacter]MCZ2813045.1 oxidoreductase [Modestobacter sp. VKM Ac-2979]MCZ2842926.1 oxidoreductase [Modestobacter sp. VKM Ac-2980]
MQSAAGEDGGSAMGLIDRLRSRTTRGAAEGGRGRRGTLDRASGSADLSHLEQFVATRRGVEGYVEPRTAVTETTILLVAADGEWTRRRIDGPDTARKLSRDLAVPVYDAQITGYPQRMRDWSARQKADDKL